MAFSRLMRAVAVQDLLLVGEVERQVERALQARRHHEVRGHAAEVHADVLVGLAVDGGGREHVHVGVVEVGQRLFPVRLLELQEDGAERVRVVEGDAGGVRLHVSRRELRPRRRCGEAAAPAATAAPAAGPAGAAEAAGRLGRQPRPRRRALGEIEALVLVLVELIQDLAFLLLHAAEAAASTRAAGALAAEAARRPARWCD